MPVLSSHVDPRTIVVERGTRQRQENINDVEDIRKSIAAIGIINPIVVREQDGKVILVAGERRLKASLDLGWTEVPIRNFQDLSSEEAETIELEENIKRRDLSWRDQVRSVGRLHILHKKRDRNWKVEQTAEAISLHPTYLRKILHVFDALDTGRLSKAESIDQAFNTLHRFAERKAESIVGDIIVNGAKIFGQSNVVGVTAKPETIVNDMFTSTSAISVLDENLLGEDKPTENKTEASADTGGNSTIIILPPPKPQAIQPTGPVICADFCEWIKTYSGPKFTLIHCDFPYGNYRGGDSLSSLSALETEEFYDNNESVYWTLLDALTRDLDRIMSYSAHMMFWFNMNFYTETVSRLRKTGLMVHDHPLIHHKTGGPGGLGVVPGTAVTYPRRTYDTALLCVRGNRPLAKPGMNSYAAPTAGNKIHPSQKPEPMLRFFLSMLVDETTTMLDPTCGSGAALRAAEDLGAKSVLGLELDANYASSALTKTLQARVMRQAGTLRREEA